MSLSLDTVWLGVADDPADRIRLSGTAALTRKREVRARVQAVAGGGTRVIRRVGQTITWDLKAPHAVRAEVDWLEDHAGVELTARDHRGHKLHGVVLSTPVDENGVTTRGGLQLTLQEVTATEAV